MTRWSHALRMCLPVALSFFWILGVVKLRLRQFFDAGHGKKTTPAFDNKKSPALDLALIGATGFH